MGKHQRLVPILASIGLASSTTIICLLAFRHEMVLEFLGLTYFVNMIGLLPILSILYFIGMFCYGASNAVHRNFTSTAACTIFLISVVMQIIELSLLQSSASNVLYLLPATLGIAASLVAALHQSPSILFTFIVKAVPLTNAAYSALQFSLLKKNDVVLLIANACLASVAFFVVSVLPLAALAVGNLLIYVDYSGQTLGSTAMSAATIEASLAAILAAMEVIKYTNIRKEILMDIKQKQQRGVPNSYATMD